MRYFIRILRLLVVCNNDWCVIVSQYTGDPSNTTWFPMQSFHVSAAVRPVSAGDISSLRFIEVDLPEASDSNHPPMFAFIARRTKGVKVPTP